MTADRELQPVSGIQHQIWFLERLLPERLWYHIPYAWRISGRLDRAALHRALHQVIARHEALRTHFVEEDGVPYQVIEARPRVDLPLTDLAELTEPTQTATVSRIIDEELGRTFDLYSGPLLRARLLRLGAEEHVLVVTFHHLVFDGWSTGIFLTELGAFYDDEAAALPPLQAQYRDYVAWQRARAGSPQEAADLGYWTDLLADAPRLLDMPTDRPRRPVTSAVGGSREGSLPGTLLDSIATFGRETENATPFMVLLSAYAVLLARYTGQQDLCIGCPIATRTRAEWQPLIGFFVSTLPMRIDLSGRPTFRQLVRRVRAATLDAYAHLHAPLEHLAQVLPRGSAPAHAPLFQAIFAMQTGFGDRLGHLAIPGLRIEPIDIESRSAKADLILGVGSDADGGLRLALEYSADLYDPATATRLLRQLHGVLESAMAGPDLPVSRLSLLLPGERDQATGAGRPSAVTAPTTTTAPAATLLPTATLVPAGIARWAATAPAGTAISAGGRRWSYAEVDVRANRLAHRLRALGVGAEEPVAIWLERGAEVVIAALAVLKAGGGYLPLDPGLPRARLEMILAEVGPRVLLTQASLLDRAPRHDAHLLVLDDPAEAARLDVMPATGPAVRIRPDHLAYVIFTSGSTGRPKGVMVEHAQLSRLFPVTEPLFGFDADDVWTTVHSTAFDFSVWEMWGALVHGGRLVVVPEQAARSPHDLLALLVAEKVTVLCQTPSALRGLTAVLAREPAAREALALRVVILGGEALTAADVAGWFAVVGTGGPRLVNMYGITETTVHTTYRPVLPTDAGERAGSPIGGPLGDVALHVLDDELAPVAEGVPGELYVGGAGVARGYLGRPVLTAQRFLPDPFGHPGARMYRSGDRVRRTGDGGLEYLGRLDDQVSIRGYRIEPGEIESALGSHPEVAACAVAVRGGSSGEQRLVAYVVPVDGGGLPAGLRAYLARSVPTHMLPGAYVPLAALPLTRNGKLDRAALPPPPPPASAAPRPGGDPRRRTLHRLFSTVLGTGEVGPDDDFFDLGGHSITALRLALLAEEALAVPVRVADVFQAPTIRELAARLAVPAVDGRSTLVPFGAETPGRPRLVLVHPAGGGLDCYAPLARALGDAFTVSGIVPDGLDSGTRPDRSIEEMAARYVKALGDAPPGGADDGAGPVVLGGWSFGGVVAFEMALQLRQRTATEARVVLLDSRAAPFLAERTAEPPPVLPPRYGDRSTADVPAERLDAVFRAHLDALLAYRPAGACHGRLAVLRAADGPDDGSGPDLGWRRWSAGELLAGDVPGDHHSMLADEHADELAARLRRLLTPTSGPLTPTSGPRPAGSGNPG
ncbi:non-ribosomal peptide synthetase [Plantactinospora sp. WMMB334]|uniref:non-ribosomal peptide synthetase n=1 Tax=Plantactinospora sp. WMMB334 TaxID=3404119 RepID=UPI003B93E50F